MKFSDYFLPFPKKVKFWKALKWWLSAGFKTYDRRHRRKYCSECGWQIIYLDDFYGVQPEAYSPDVVAICSFCGIEFVEFESFSGKTWAVLPKK